MKIYHAITFSANALAVLLLRGYIHITQLSLVPLALLGLMFFQATFFKNEPVERGFRTSYGSELTADEETRRMQFAARSLLCAAPWMLPFVFFFPSAVKLLSILVYLLGLIGGLLIYRVRFYKNFKARMDAEEAER